MEQGELLSLIGFLAISNNCSKNMKENAWFLVLEMQRLPLTHWMSIVCCTRRFWFENFCSSNFNLSLRWCSSFYVRESVSHASTLHNFPLDSSQNNRDISILLWSSSCPALRSFNVAGSFRSYRPVSPWIFGLPNVIADESCPRLYPNKILFKFKDHPPLQMASSALVQAWEDWSWIF